MSNSTKSLYSMINNNGDIEELEEYEGNYFSNSFEGRDIPENAEFVPKFIYPPTEQRENDNDIIAYEDFLSLRPIEEFEFEEPETVCGLDERTEINNTTEFPFRAICMLLITRSDGGKSRGTGWFNGLGTIITAGHCVYSSKVKKWHKSITVFPGRSGSLNPYGSQTSKIFWSVKGWTEDHDSEYDYGAIILPNRELGNKVGHFGFRYDPDSFFNNRSLNLCGYPGDKPYGTQWFMYDKIASVEDRKLKYMLDTAGGQSGAPSWLYFPQNDQRHSVGIHAYGGCPNGSTRINKPVFQNLLNWKKLGEQ